MIIDGYNQTASDKGVSHSLTAQRSDPDNVSVVLVGEDNEQDKRIWVRSRSNKRCRSSISADEKMGQTYIHKDQANTLAQRDYKQPQAVIYEEEEDDSDRV